MADNCERVAALTIHRDFKLAAADRLWLQRCGLLLLCFRNESVCLPVAEGRRTRQLRDQ
jgi:hypothetical protein